MLNPRFALYARALLAAASLWGCSRENVRSSPTAPKIPAAPNVPGVPSVPIVPIPSGGWIWVMVLEESGMCITGANVVVVRGEGVGQSLTHTRPCNAWSYDAEIMFVGLTLGATVTIRASAPGYATREVTAYAQRSGQATEIVLTRMPLHP